MNVAEELELYVEPSFDEVGVSVVGAILTADWERDSQAIEDVFHDVPEAAFVDQALREIYAAERRIFRRDHRVDVITLADELKARGAYVRVGGADVISRLRVDREAHAI